MFFNDILIYSNRGSLRYLELALELLKRHKLFAKRSKCQFGCHKIGYLEHLILVQEVRADPEKLRAMVEWPRPKNLKALRGFLGLTGYYRYFIKNYGSIVVGLTTLLKKNSFKWDEVAEEVYKNLKGAITQPPIL